jgi:hypothetical protein
MEFMLKHWCIKRKNNQPIIDVFNADTWGIQVLEAPIPLPTMSPRKRLWWVDPFDDDSDDGNAKKNKTSLSPME